MSEYTPGPWEMETVKTQVGSCHKIGPLGFDHSGREIHACVYVDGYIWPDDLSRTKEGQRSIANARLIAAAPELLEACKRALHFMRNVAAEQELIDQVSDAIVKAEAQ